MAYAYWKSGKVDDSAVFDIYFRKNPFEGEFTIFAGLDECLRFLENFRYSESDIDYLRETLPDGIEEEFFTYLSNLTTHDVTLHAMEEGSVAFPRYTSLNSLILDVSIYLKSLLKLLNIDSTHKLMPFLAPLQSTCHQN